MSSNLTIRSDMLKGIAVIGSIVWISTILFVYTQLSNNTIPASGSQETVRSWRHVLESLEALKEQNIDLRHLLEKERDERSRQHEQILQNSHSDNKDHIEQPKKLETLELKTSLLSPYDTEVTRRLLDDRIREVFFMLKSQNIENATKSRLETQMISLMGLSSKLETSSGLEEERKRKRSEISDQIIKSIKKLQNPKKCDEPRVLVCNLDKECGFGCQLHHVTYCAITAFATQRMLILKRDGSAWKYSQKGWNSVFEPISKCTYDEAVGKTTQGTFSETSTERVVALGIVDSLVVKPNFLPQAVPANILKNISMIHSNPPAFFIGTFISYLMRFNPETQKKMKEAFDQIPASNDDGPIIGLQIRRTDKVGTEAAFHSLAEYMEWAEIKFKVEDRKKGSSVKRRIFIASDDPTVVPEAKKNYPNYEVYGSTEIAQTAQLGNRYTDASLMGVITDIYILSKVDYLVCTFSSQVCRMGYELRQPYGQDDGSKFHSLDDIYYFGGQQSHEVVAIEEHEPETTQQIALKIGDKIGIAGNHWDGYSKGTNRRTNKLGIFPSYKVVNEWRTFDFKALLV